MTEKEEEELDNQQNQRILKWTKMLDEFELYKNTRYSKLKERTRKGIPEGMRGIAWIKIAGIQQLRKGKENLYNDLVSKIKVDENLIEKKDEDVIIRDLHRTFPKNMMFSTKLGEGQRTLFRILMCFASYSKSTGYVQGMGFYAALFLSYMDEEHSFWMLCSLFRRYNLEELFTKDFPGLKKRCYILLKLIDKFMPKVNKKLKEAKINPTMYASQWFFTCFTNTLPFDITVRIFDCFLLEGEKIIYRVILAILKYIQDEIESADGFETIMNSIKNVSKKIKSPDDLLNIAFKFSFSRSDLTYYTLEYNKMIKENENELCSVLGF